MLTTILAVISFIFGVFVGRTHPKLKTFKEPEHTILYDNNWKN